MCHMVWPRPNIGAMWHGLGQAYVPCDMSYVVPKCHVGWLKLSLCGTWHGLGLTYVTCLMLCLDAAWHVLTYVPHGMA
jgi:hypothetical protein